MQQTPLTVEGLLSRPVDYSSIIAVLDTLLSSADERGSKRSLTECDDMPIGSSPSSSKRRKPAVKLPLKLPLKLPRKPANLPKRIEYTLERLGYNYDEELNQLRAMSEYTERHGQFCVDIVNCLVKQFMEQNEPEMTFEDIAMEIEGFEGDETIRSLKFVGRWKQADMGFYFRPSTLNWKFGSFPSALQAALACDAFHRLLHFRGDIQMRVLSGYLPHSNPQVEIVV